MELFEETYKTNNTIKKIDKNEDFLTQIMKIEREYKIHKDYFNYYHPNQFNWKMRAILIDWLFEVADDFKLKRDTLYEAISILDRFFQTKSKIIEKSNLQHLGLTALHIAAKKEVYTFLNS